MCGHIARLHDRSLTLWLNEPNPIFDQNHLALQVPRRPAAGALSGHKPRTDRAGGSGGADVFDEPGRWHHLSRLRSIWHHWIPQRDTDVIRGRPVAGRHAQPPAQFPVAHIWAQFRHRRPVAIGPVGVPNVYDRRQLRSTRPPAKPSAAHPIHHSPRMSRVFPGGISSGSRAVLRSYLLAELILVARVGLLFEQISVSAL